MILWIVAAAPCSFPRSEFGTDVSYAGMPVSGLGFGGCVDFEAATTFCVAGSELLCFDDSDLSALANALPCGVGCFAKLNPVGFSNHGEPSKHFSQQIELSHG